LVNIKIKKLRKMLMFINQCHTKQLTCRAVVAAHSDISGSAVRS